jgi:hypothetical protein
VSLAIKRPATSADHVRHFQAHAHAVKLQNMLHAASCEARTTVCACSDVLDISFRMSALILCINIEPNNVADDEQVSPTMT